MLHIKCPLYLITPLFPSRLNSSHVLPKLFATQLWPLNSITTGNSQIQLQFPHQLEDWKVFYTRALDYLEALDINADEADNWHTGWKQLKMMFKGEDKQTLQSLIDNGTITLEHKKIPKDALDATGITIKAKEHFWHFWDELLSEVHQLPDEGIHALPTCIYTLITQYKFTHPKPRRCLKSLSCNTQCDTMRPETRSGSWTSPSSPTSSFLPNVNCLSCGVSSIRKPRRGDELTSLP